MAINCVRQVFVLTEQELAVDYYGGVSAVQSSPSNILITFHGKNETSTELSAPAQVSQLKVTSGRVHSTFEISIPHLVPDEWFFHICHTDLALSQQKMGTVLKM